MRFKVLAAVRIQITVVLHEHHVVWYMGARVLD